MTVTVYPEPDVAVRARALVGEGPVWDERTGRLCWVDLIAGTLFEEDFTAARHHHWTVDTLLGAALPRRSQPGFAVAVSEGFGFVVDGELTVADAALPEPHRRMNDAACDSRGRLWAGSTHLDFTPAGGTLHRWDGTSPSTVMATGFTLPNGLGWSPDDTRMYLVDSIGHTLLSASYSPDDGMVGTFTPLCTIDEGLPDGLAIDVDGCVWVAVWGGAAVHRYSPTGELIGRVPLPVAKPSSCAFGPDGTLYITSASTDIDEVELTRQPLAGSVFALASGTHGVPVLPFAG